MISTLSAAFAALATLLAAIGLLMSVSTVVLTAVAFGRRLLAGYLPATAGSAGIEGRSDAVAAIRVVVARS